MDTQAIQFTREALWLVLMLSAPPLLAATLIALLVSIAQAVTQVQEQTVQHLAKFVAVTIALLATAPLMGGALYQFADRLLRAFPGLVH